MFVTFLCLCSLANTAALTSEDFEVGTKGGEITVVTGVSSSQNSQTVAPPVDAGCFGNNANNGRPFANNAAGVCVRYRCQALEGTTFIVGNSPCSCMNSNDCFFAWRGLAGAEFELQPVCSGANLAANTDGTCVSGPTSPPLSFPNQDNYWSTGCAANIPCGNTDGNCQRTLCANAGTCTNTNCACTTDAGCVGAWTRSQPVTSCINGQCRAPTPFQCLAGEYNLNGGTTVDSCVVCPPETPFSPAGSTSSADCLVSAPASPAAAAVAGLSIAVLSGIVIGGLLLLAGAGAAFFYIRRAKVPAPRAPTSQKVPDWGATGGSIQAIPTTNPVLPDWQVFSDPQGRQFTRNSKTGETSWLPTGGNPPPPPTIPGTIS